MCPRPRCSDEELQQEEDNKALVRGRMTFITRNPGQQLLCGSFQPIQHGEWCASAYRTPFEDLVHAIMEHDYDAVREILSASQAPVDVNWLTLDGWSPLQVALKKGAYDIIPDLIREGARWPKHEETRGIPIYREHSSMRLGAFSQSEQVDRLALLVQHLLVHTYTPRESM